MKTYEFTVTLCGTGETQEEAWDNAIEAFCEDPGIPHDDVIIYDEEDELGDYESKFVGYT